MVPLRVPWCKKPNLKLSQERVSSHWLGVIEVIVITMKCGWSGRSITWTNWLSIAFCRVIWDKRLSQLISSSHQTVRSCLTVIDNILSYSAHARSCTKLNNFCLFFWQGMNNFLFVTLFLTSLHLPGPTPPPLSPWLWQIETSVTQPSGDINIGRLWFLARILRTWNVETCGGDSDIRVSMAFDNWSFKCESDESHCRVLISTWEVGGG